VLLRCKIYVWLPPHCKENFAVQHKAAMRGAQASINALLSEHDQLWIYHFRNDRECRTFRQAKKRRVRRCTIPAKLPAPDEGL
jgi:hypothetical protein